MVNKMFATFSAIKPGHFTASMFVGYMADAIFSPDIPNGYVGCSAKNTLCVRGWGGQKCLS
jgi:hypothetical protein